MKIHYHLVEKVVQALEQIFDEQKYSDKVIEKIFKQNRKLGSRDRKFIAESVYEVVRHYRYYQYIMDSDNLFDLVCCHLIKASGELPPLAEFNEYDVRAIREALKSPKKIPDKIRYSFPDWLVELGQKEFGETEWNLLMKSLNDPAQVHLRANRLKIDRDQLIEKLKAEDIYAERATLAPDALTLSERKNVFTTQAFKQGLFEVQDVSSQMVAPMLEVISGHRVVDACAGAGGKSLHLAALMKNKGKIISMDIHEWKLNELKKRAARDGVDIIETKVIENSKIIKRLDKSFDRVLLDVPCSGLGVLRRNPDTKWKLSQEEINRLIELQRHIISEYSNMCKPGGQMLYATCSILKSENEDQIKWFLGSENGKNWELKKELRLWPHRDGYDGFYAALLLAKPTRP